MKAVVAKSASGLTITPRSEHTGGAAHRPRFSRTRLALGRKAAKKSPKTALRSASTISILASSANEVIGESLPTLG
jgi:hypothetical protein